MARRTQTQENNRRHRTLPLTDITVDPAIQARTSVNPTAVAEYTQAMSDGEVFPPVIVFSNGRRNWLADGFHRYEAAAKAGISRLQADLRRGTRRDAILFAIGANAAHGLRRTNADKRKAVLTLLNDRTWRRWSDRELARRANVSNRFVSNIRSELTVNVPSERIYVTRHGSVSTMRTQRIGKKNSPSPATNLCPEEYRNTVLCGDALSVLATFPDACIDCILTSPPYYGLRDFATWSDDGDENQLGLETSFEEYLQNLLAITAELKRVLKYTGTMWWNHGDSYGTGSGSGVRTGKQAPNRGTQAFERRKADGKPPVLGYEKCLRFQPYRLAVRMMDEQGWILRNQIIWHKPNCMPSSMHDRFTVDYESLFLFTKRAKYFFERQFEAHESRQFSARQDGNRAKKFRGGRGKSLRYAVRYNNPNGRNKRSVWTTATKPYPDAHFAVFPPALIETPIQAGCPELVCRECGTARQRVYKGTSAKAFNIRVRDVKRGRKKDAGRRASQEEIAEYEEGETHTGEGRKVAGYTECGCDADFQPGVVLDPFLGSGTTALVAKKLKRDYVGIEISAEYCAMAEKRVEQAR